MGWTLRVVWRAEWGRALLLAAVVGLGAGAAGAAPWDERDVAAAESYRAVERERADRYRARVAQEKSAAAERPRERRSESTAAGAIAALWERAAGAVLAEFDLASIESALAAARSGWTWWEEEASPRVRRAWDVVSQLIDPAAG